jgi:hypothetical protein
MIMSRRTIHVSILSLLVGVSCAEIPDGAGEHQVPEGMGEGPEASQPVHPSDLVPSAPEMPAEPGAPLALTAAQSKLPTDGWAQQPGGTNNDKVWAVAAAPNGDVYAVGYTHSPAFAGQTNVGGGSGTADAFLVRYDVAKNLRSVTVFGTTANDFATGIAVCPDGSAYVAGYTFGTLTNGGALHAGNGDLFVTKFEASGAQRWTRQMGTSSVDKALAVAVDCTRAFVYVAGETSGNLGGQINASAGVEDAFLSKFRDNGASVTHLFTKLIGTTSKEQSHAVAVDAEGDVYVAGVTYGSLPTYTNPDPTKADLFVARYDLNGARHALDQRGTPADDVAKGIGVARVDGVKRVYVVGYTGGALNNQVSKGGLDAVLLQYVRARLERGLHGHELSRAVFARVDLASLRRGEERVRGLDGRRCHLQWMRPRLRLDRGGQRRCRGGRRDEQRHGQDPLSARLDLGRDRRVRHEQQ